MKVVYEEAEQKAHDWREEVRIDPKLNAQREKFIAMKT